MNQPEKINPLSIDPAKINNAVLQRLIKEVQHEIKNDINSYNRVHNRHNRSSNGNTISHATTAP